MLKIVFFVNLLLFSLNLLGQDKIAIKGIVKDTSGQPIIGAYVKLINNNGDSLLTTSNVDGIFQFPSITPIPFKLSINSMGFVPWLNEYRPGPVDSIIILPQIILSVSSKMLNEIVVKSRKAPVTLKRDTIEFSISQYHLRENAVVEDLLKRLPGLRVEKDGSISYMGQKITRIRMNGKDFPINGIQSLTQLLSANLLSKIQLIDDYGEFANLTGRNTGIADKIINLETIADIKRTLQVKGTAGLGTDGIYTQELAGMYLSINRQLYVVEEANNINPASTKSNLKKGTITYRVQSGNGLNIQGSTFSEHTDNLVNSFSKVINITSEGNLITESNSTNKTSNTSYNLIGGADYKSPRGLNISTYFRGSLVYQDNLSLFDNSQSGIQYLQQIFENNDRTKSPIFSGNITGSQYFKKKRMRLTMGLNIGYSENQHDSKTNNLSRYFDTDNVTIIKDSLLIQLIKKSINYYRISPQASIIKEIDSTKSIELRYTSDSRTNKNIQSTSILDQGGKYVTIDSLSNKFNYSTNIHAIGTNFKFDNKKVNYLIGVNFNYYGYNKRDGSFISPYLNVGYKLNESSDMSVRYGMSAMFPSLVQVQPITDNTNPLLPIIGNPDLRIGYNHSISVDYRHAGKSTLVISVNGGPSLNSVTTNTILVENDFKTIKQETRFVNVNGNYNLNGTYNWSYSFLDGKVQLFLDGTATISKNIFFTNYIRQENKNTIINQALKTGYYLKWLEGSMGVNYTYNKNQFGSQTNTNTAITNWNLTFDNKFFIEKQLALSFEINKQLNRGYNGAVSANPTLINAAIEKSIFDKKLTFKIQGYNLLNQKNSVLQAVSTNTITETRNTLLGRYILFSMQFDLKKEKRK